MTGHALRTGGFAFLVLVACASAPLLAHAAYLDESGDIRLGVRTYVGVRVGSEHTDKNIQFLTNEEGQVIVDRVTLPSTGQQVDVPRQGKRSLTFPVSADGHIRQNRFFAEVELDHDLMRLLKEGFGPLALLNDLPFEFRKLRYHITYRGEGEGIYDYGPSEYRTAYQYFDPVLVPPFIRSGPEIPSPDPDVELHASTVLNEVEVTPVRRRLRRVAQHRNRLFQAFLEAEAGDLNLRFGRQILVWGETDAFRLLDNINPIDNGFGGFLIALDERRVPLDMLVANYYFGDFWGALPVYGAYLEFFGAIDSHVAFQPGIPEGSPWALPNLGDPSATLVTFREDKARTFEDARFGGLLSMTVPVQHFSDVRLQFANYYTYFDTPAVQIFTTRGFPFAGFNESDGAPPGTQGALAIAEQTAPKVQVTGLSSSFGIPARFARFLALSGEPQIRTELAYFKGEPRFTQGALDPFVFAAGACTGPHSRQVGDDKEGNPPETGAIGCTGGRATGDSWNFVLGVDHNQYIRFLNPNQSFFISTQFFYKHLNGAQKRRAILTGGDRGDVIATEGEVLPVPEFEQSPVSFNGLSAVQPSFVHNPVDQYLQTLFITTSYFSGQVIPSLTLFYDWSGSFTAIPQVTFSRDPFRFSIGYSYLEAGRLKGASGLSLLRDRDNVLFQLEYVI